jgi:hypothetical protein
MPLLYVRIELLDERSDMPGDGSGERVVLVLEALPNGCQPYASIASRIYLALRRRFEWRADESRSRSGRPSEPRRRKLAVSLST